MVGAVRSAIMLRSTLTPITAAVFARVPNNRAICTPTPDMVGRMRSGLPTLLRPCLKTLKASCAATLWVRTRSAGAVVERAVLRVVVSPRTLFITRAAVAEVRFAQGSFHCEKRPAPPPKSCSQNQKRNRPAACGASLFARLLDLLPQARDTSDGGTVSVRTVRPPPYYAPAPHPWACAHSTSSMPLLRTPACARSAPAPAAAPALAEIALAPTPARAPAPRSRFHSRSDLPRALARVFPPFSLPPKPAPSAPSARTQRALLLPALSRSRLPYP